MIKVALIIGLAGACPRHELTSLELKKLSTVKTNAFTKKREIMKSNSHTVIILIMKGYPVC